MARPKRSRAEWTKVVAKYRASGLTAEVFAARHDLNVSTLRWWSAEIGSASACVPALRELVVEREVGSADRSFELTLGAIGLRFEVGTDPRYVAAVAAALVEAGRAC